MWKYLCVLLCLSGPLMAWADDVICEDSVTVGKYRRYQGSVDLTQVVPQPNEVCHPIPEAQIPAQRAACYDSNIPPPTIPLKYRKVTDNLCVEMSQPEKNQVDAAENAQQAQNAAYQQEKGGPQCGEKQLDQITSKINQQKGQRHAALDTAHTAIDQVINALTTWDLATGQAMLKQITADFYTQLGSTTDDEYKWTNDLYRCLRAQVGSR